MRNFGVTKGADGTLGLEEKGTVYNEMVASMANGGWQAWRAQSHAVYGAKGLDRSNGSFFVIGPDKQLDVWEQYLQGVAGPGTGLQRLYGRDFWVP